jgi:Protein of unknown function (DUF2800)
VHGESKTIREWPIKLSKLRAIESEAIEALHLAHEADAPLVAGTHCEWCGAAATCKALAEYNLRNAVEVFEDIRTRPVINPKDPRKLSNDGLSYLLSQVYVMESWLRAIESEAVRRLMAREPVPGYKLTAGRSMRSWSDERRVEKMLLAAGLPEEQVYKKEMRGPAQIEKIVKNAPKLAQRVAAFIVKKPGAPHVAPENDPRPALAGAAALVFKPVPKKGGPSNAE